MSNGKNQNKKSTAKYFTEEDANRPQIESVQDNLVIEEYNDQTFTYDSSPKRVYEDSEDEPGPNYQSSSVIHKFQKEPINTYPIASHAGRKKRQVLSFSQRARLESVFSRCKYINSEMSGNLAQELGLTMRQIKIWFKSRRFSQKRKEARNTAMLTESHHPHPSFDSTWMIRRVFSVAQRARLESVFLQSNYINGEMSSNLAQELGLTKMQIQKWFINRRFEQKKREIQNTIMATEINSRFAHTVEITQDFTANDDQDIPPKANTAQSRHPEFEYIDQPRHTIRMQSNPIPAQTYVPMTNRAVAEMGSAAYRTNQIPHRENRVLYSTDQMQQQNICINPEYPTHPPYDYYQTTNPDQLHPPLPPQNFAPQFDQPVSNSDYPSHIHPRSNLGEAQPRQSYESHSSYQYFNPPC